MAEPAWAGDDMPCAAAPPPLSGNADSGLMAATARGDAQAYARLVDRHLPAIYHLCYRLTGCREEAEDLTQESFVRLWQFAPGWREAGGGVPAWLHRVARNLCFDRLRTSNRRAAGPCPDVTDGAPDAVRRIETTQLQQQLDDCLRRLSPSHRSALLLSYYEGYSNAIAAQVMDMKLKAFESLLVRARRRLCAELSIVGVRREDIELLS